VIFADVKLVQADDAERLRSLGMPLVAASKKSASQETGSWRFPQPCAALNGCLCSLYSSRPSHCRRFECLLLKDLQRGEVTREEALRLIRSARRRVKRIETLLRALGENDKALSLRGRIVRLAKRLQRAELEPSVAQLFGELSIASHRLNLLLQDRFYPAA